MPLVPTPITFEESHEIVKGLIRDFQARESYYLKSDYQEAETRKDFLDKFFIALGWDVNHDHQKNPYEQEVKVEPPVSVEGRNKRADYSFSVAPNFRVPRFYAEAKKPSGELKSPQNYFQTIRYAWNRSTSLAVLTNFYEFHVLDCRYKPNIDNSIDRAIEGFSFSYKDFLKEDSFRRIYFLFSREAVAAGAIEKVAEELRPPRGKAYQKGLFKGGYQKIDDTILVDLDDYRLVLAKAFKRTNPKIEDYALTEAVQRTIDRLVFIRFLEDKLIEEKDHVSNFGDGGSVWTDFVITCRKLDPKYNGLIFHEHFIDKTDFHPPDENEFGDICENLAHVNSPYDFNAIPIDILGSIYERFLGKVIRTTDKQVRVEEKDEVKKAGGVFYTPQSIVQFIVENTISKIIDGKNPLKISLLKFVDISCGSGSFLLSVYDHLIQYHVRYFTEYPKQRNTDDCETIDGVLKLTLKKKREILLNNIFGVDIDLQAVEVTQLSLYLKLLDEETFASTSQLRLEFKAAILPSLEENIKCGNSLVGTDILEQNLFPTNAERQLNPMNFEDAFPEIIKNGGFDAVVGNPPWISLSGKFRAKIYTQPQVDYLIRRFNGNTYMPNMYEYFITRGFEITKPGGYFGYIVPDRFGFNGQFVNLRKIFLEEASLKTLIYKLPFPGITADTMVFILDKTPSKPDSQIEISEYGKPALLRKQEEIFNNPNHTFDYYENAESFKLLNKILSSKFLFLSGVCESTSGFGGKSKLISEKKINNNQIKTIKGDSIGRYFTKNYYWFEFKKTNITGRTTDKNKLGVVPKILLRKTGDSIIATYDDSGIFPEQSLYFLFNNKTKMDFKYLLGVLNSELMNYFFKMKCLTNKKSIAQVKKEDLDLLPIRKIDFSNKAEKESHDKLVLLVNQRLKYAEKSFEAKTEKDKNYTESLCSSFERQIDEIVYQLYNISNEEIKIIRENI